ncbi:hypothetical protein VMCG_08886 [Cytospora schulzeri]|uniref:Uncharacterized protein n=1 Tax=Cytospora schulzeri TaxID=448051 RepID=A0A423VUP0_9PEZI|nr:hypothetical protein VMCG_08886 [Valsa malicola]
MCMITRLEDVRVFNEQFGDPAASQCLATMSNANTRCQQLTTASPMSIQAMVDMSQPLHRATTRPLDWTTMYARVQFDNERLSIVERKEKQQGHVITGDMLPVASMIVFVFLVGLMRLSMWANAPIEGGY